MRHVKLYEQYDFEDLSDEELFGTNRGPYDNILEYGENGQEFKAGDRVVLKKDQNRHLREGEIGTVVCCSADDYLICFDFYTYGHEGNPDETYNIPSGHGWYVQEKYLEKI